ncbi:hypothetical protein HanHA300_Chr15g0579841 [Helianthus annuus]|nr:hypothetical protein HanHA300_Chr15g0579841 [Helianthus annuus]KAJ0457441.1 hypothetical protein HanIR_Chr15g0773781 [Helianthus annuus]KAJ0474417.1 hypothetical protein HanHA89_Chr15g0629491 [Helianthus annuus]KAJ0649980.1 hypothetical protein HanLR1_Chr15g0590471 [Helianthus annuus]KAJ0653765.1 hypothetical protein HanOQP8_Chr15g0587261 [Helianthus annuus]
MNRALSDFKKKYPSGFQHIEAWEVVRKHDKWATVPLLGEDSEGSGQKRKSLDAGTPGTESPIDIPDINVDPSLTRQKRKDKRPASSSNDSQEALNEKLAQYTLMKEEKKARAIELTNIRKKREEDTIALVAEQREAVKQLMYDRYLKTFTMLHPRCCHLFSRGNEISQKKYNLPCNF